VLVDGVQRGGPADRAGIRPGDVIVAVDGTRTPTTEQLALSKLKPGQRVKVQIVSRSGKRSTVTVKLGVAPAG
jgi:S1-C subfamily serine protease